LRLPHNEPIQKELLLGSYGGLIVADGALHVVQSLAKPSTLTARSYSLPPHAPGSTRSKAFLSSSHAGHCTAVTSIRSRPASAARADELAAQDDHHGQAICRRITETVSQLTNMTSPGALH